MQYRIHQIGDRLKLQHIGAFDVYPLGFVRGKQRLSGAQLAVRDVLRRPLEADGPSTTSTCGRCRYPARKCV